MIFHSAFFSNFVTDFAGLNMSCATLWYLLIPYFSISSFSSLVLLVSQRKWCFQVLQPV